MKRLSAAAHESTMCYENRKQIEQILYIILHSLTHSHTHTHAHNLFPQVRNKVKSLLVSEFDCLFFFCVCVWLLLLPVAVITVCVVFCVLNFTGSFFCLLTYVPLKKSNYINFFPNINLLNFTTS